MPPRVSVVIPTYNNAQFITEAIASVVRQSFADWELIVVDDGSTDDTKQIVSALGVPLRYHYQPNQGLAVARNTGLALACGTYVTYLDADDVWEPDNLLTKDCVLRECPDLGGVFSEFCIFDQSGVTHARGMHTMFPFFRRAGVSLDDVLTQQRFAERPGGRVSFRLGSAFEGLFRGNFILPTSMVFNRESALQTGTFRPHLRTQQDYEYWLRFSQNHSIAFVDEVLVRYRRHPQQLTDHSRIENILLAVISIIGQYEQRLVSQNRRALYNKRRSEVLTDLARVYVRQGRTREARRILAEVFRRAPSHGPAYSTMAVALLPRPLISWIWR